MSEMVVPESLVHKIVWALFEWSKQHQVLAGVVVDAFSKAGMKSGMDGVEPVVEYEDTEDIDVVGIGCNETVRSMLKDMNVPLLETGVIRVDECGHPERGHRRGLGTMSIMVEADPRFPDARAAAALIEKLNTLLPTIDLPQEPLLAEA